MADEKFKAWVKRKVIEAGYREEIIRFSCIDGAYIAKVEDKIIHYRPTSRYIDITWGAKASNSMYDRHRTRLEVPWTRRR